SVALAQARQAGVFTAAHEAFWAAARARPGDGPGTRERFEELLRDPRRAPGAATVVAVEARKPAPAAGRADQAARPPPRRSAAAVITLPRRGPELPPD